MHIIIKAEISKKLKTFFEYCDIIAKLAKKAPCWALSHREGTQQGALNINHFRLLLY